MNDFSSTQVKYVVKYAILDSRASENYVGTCTYSRVSKEILHSLCSVTDLLGLRERPHTHQGSLDLYMSYTTGLLLLDLPILVKYYYLLQGVAKGCMSDDCEMISFSQPRAAGSRRICFLLQSNTTSEGPSESCGLWTGDNLH